VTQTGRTNLAYLLSEIGFPRDLRLERQLVSSVLMAWSPPDHVPQSQIQSYQVFVDGHLKAAIRGNDRTKALLEKVDIAKVSSKTNTSRRKSAAINDTSNLLTEQKLFVFVDQRIKKLCCSHVRAWLFNLYKIILCKYVLYM